jgi:NADPH:quinone reductase-like Zn-dependent oxidoreductase
LPGYTFGTALSSQRTFVTKSMDLFSSQKLKPVMEGPFPFTTEGVRSAFRLQESRHAHGKVVIHVADK